MAIVLMNEPKEEIMQAFATIDKKHAAVRKRFSFAQCRNSFDRLWGIYLVGESLTEFEISVYAHADTKAYEGHMEDEGHPITEKDFVDYWEHRKEIYGQLVNGDLEALERHGFDTTLGRDTHSCDWGQLQNDLENG